MLNFSAKSSILAMKALWVSRLARMICNNITNSLKATSIWKILLKMKKKVMSIYQTTRRVTQAHPLFSTDSLTPNMTQTTNRIAAKMKFTSRRRIRLWNPVIKRSGAMSTLLGVITRSANKISSSRRSQTSRQIWVLLVSDIADPAKDSIARCSNTLQQLSHSQFPATQRRLILWDHTSRTRNSS